jgi:hypothetical protein
MCPTSSELAQPRVRRGHGAREYAERARVEWRASDLTRNEKDDTCVSMCERAVCFAGVDLNSKRELSGRSGAVGIARDRRPRAPRCHRPRVNLAPRVSSLREVWDAGERLGKRGDPPPGRAPCAMRRLCATRCGVAASDMSSPVLHLHHTHSIHIMSRHTVSQISSMLTVSPGVPWRYGRTGHAHASRAPALQKKQSSNRRVARAAPPASASAVPSPTRFHKRHHRKSRAISRPRRTCRRSVNARGTGERPQAATADARMGLS